MSETILRGGCYCGAVRYECALPISKPVICHCTSCRRSIGAHAVAWMTVNLASFRPSGEALREYASSEGVLRMFCERCGCAIGYRHRKYADEIDLTVSSLDDPSAVVPTHHIWMSNAPTWDRPGDGLPQHSEWRTPPASSSG